MSSVNETVSADRSYGSRLNRRDALKLLAANIALAASGCGKPSEEIVPYVKMPERLVPGIPLQFATTLSLAGYGRGVIATSHEGRPTKIEGNTLHPASLGATDVFAEAEIFNLYDPERSQTIRHNGEISGWNDFAETLKPQLAIHQNDEGAGLRVLTGRIASPTLLRQLKILQTKFPAMAWHAYEPIEDKAAKAGAQMAYGRPIQSLPRFQDADVVLTFDADPIGPGPQQIALARALSERRRPRGGNREMSRLYAIESVPSLSGAAADHRLLLAPYEIGKFAWEIARGLGANPPPSELDPNRRRFADSALRDLQAHKGRSVVLAGRSQPAEIHALTYWLNAKLNAPLTFIDPVAGSETQPGLKQLADDLQAGKVQTLVILACNPAYDAPADLNFADAVKRADFRVQFGRTIDETATYCDWHLPASHALESWSDSRSLDGIASVVQPLIEPLYDTKTEHDVLAMLCGDFNAKPYDLVRETWHPQAGSEDFDTWWRRVLQDGVIAGTASQKLTLGEPRSPEFKPQAAKNGMTLVLMPDAALWDGRFAGNAWLQECPKPFTKEVWGNSLGLNATDAAQLQVSDGDQVRVTRGKSELDVPVRIQPGHAQGVVSLSLGYGRWNAGLIGTQVGVNAYLLRDEAALWVLDDIKLTRLDAAKEIPTATAAVKLDALTGELFPVLTLASLAHADIKKRDTAKQPSFFPTPPQTEPAWAMAIDTTACIGCNACVVACQAENNVPVVGPEEIEQGRIMQWLRIDTYQTESASSQPQVTGFQPVPCMHCEKAPCEPVCPVAASVHDSEGLNLQVYNRCVGTRFCQANCPYKVRRFNFFGYADGQEYKNLGADILKAQKNPDVSVRARGVMEKCTYCLQRISRARRAAEKENREIRDGEVVTACQAACPTRAISFGDLTKKEAEIIKLRNEPQHYALLGNLGTKPRTTYLARVRNPNPELEKGEG